MRRRMRAARWYSRRSLRARLVLVSVLPLTAAVVAGTVGVIAVYSAGRIHDLDRQTGAEADTLVGLVTTGQLPSPLPQPAGSPLLAQVISSTGDVLSATASASRTVPLISTPHTGGTTFTDDDNAYGNVPLRLRVAPVSNAATTDYVVVAAPLSDVRRALQSLRQALLLLVPLLVAAATTLAWIVVGYTLRPVERLRTSAVALAGRPLPSVGSGSVAGGSVGSESVGTEPLAATGTAYLPAEPGDDEIARLTGTLNEILRRLHDALRQQQEFIADAAHELRSPLAGLRIKLDIQRTHPGLQPASEVVAELSSDVDRLTQLTDDLLLLARLEAGATTTRREPVDLTELAGAVGPVALVSADRDALRRLVTNVVGNASRYAHGTVRTTVHVEDGRAQLTVDDDGPGIPPPDRDRVFERWTRLDGARDRDSGGSGLGLAVAKQIVTAHGGTISIDDSPLGGTRVLITLPLAASSSAEPER
ncbi:MAG: HAMP domain-containing sensor histidine kinase [bacterium]